MRKIILIALAIILSIGISASYAGEKRCPMMKGKHGKKFSVEAQAKKLTKQLKLSEGQQAQVQEILSAKKEEIKAVMNESNEKMKQIRQASYQKISALLTPEQQAQYEKMCKKEKCKLKKDKSE
ncbi:MAG: hypothetical protein KKC84_05855 [Candidatus Omnitrophica bacterium]|nr:hypothetical protein [Candidatus Omnitrophota bacterium]